VKTRADIERLSRAGVSAYQIGDDRMIARVLGEMKIVVDTRDISVTPHLVMDGFWESWITSWAISKVGKGERILNVGANCGYFALVFARLVGETGRVVAVEPQQRLAEGVEMSATLNGFGGRLAVQRCVAGSVNRVVSVRVPGRLLGGASVTSDAGEDSFLVEEVSTSDLMPDATGVFVDAEGYEPVIWEGMRAMLDGPHFRWACIEWAPSRYADPNGFLATLRRAGSLLLVGYDGEERLASDHQLLAVPDYESLVIRR